MFLSRSSGLASRVLALTLMLLVLGVIALPMAHSGPMRGFGSTSAARLVPAPVFGHTDSMFVPAMAADGPSRESVDTLREADPGSRALAVHLVLALPVSAAPRPIQAPLRI